MPLSVVSCVSAFSQRPEGIHYSTLNVDTFALFPVHRKAEPCEMSVYLLPPVSNCHRKDLKTNVYLARRRQRQEMHSISPPISMLIAAAIG